MKYTSNGSLQSCYEASFDVLDIYGMQKLIYDFVLFVMCSII
jgi:hypothetical protein